MVFTAQSNVTLLEKGVADVILQQELLQEQKELHVQIATENIEKWTKELERIQT